jgi:hypothetical protein
MAASGADAAGKLGAIEAIWEIVPRIHNSLNPVLTKQLAIALANLLGETGYFYQYVTGKSRQRENNISSLFFEAARRYPSLIKSIKRESIPAELKLTINKKMKSMKKYFEDEEYLSSYILLKECASLITNFLVDMESDRANYFRTLYLLDRKTALWWWFIEESSHQVYDSSEDIVKLDILIGIYYLSCKHSL